MTVQRKGGTLTADAIFAALKSTTFTVPDTPQNAKDPGVTVGSQITLEKKLRRSTSAQERDQSRAPDAKETMRDRVDKILSEFKEKFSGSFSDATAHAVMLSIAIDGVARIIADELYDPALKPQLAERLFQLYEGEMKAALGSTKDLDESFKRARAMSSHDPVALFMHDELRIEDAAAQIRAMAGAAKLKKRVMFAALKAKFQAELASYSLDEIQSQEDRQHFYNVKESTGEYSRKYFTGLLAPEGFDATGKPVTREGGLAFSREAAQKLQDLEQEVLNPSGVPPSATVADHVAEVTREDARVAGAREADAKAILMRTPVMGGIGGLSDAEAQNVIDKLKAGLPGLPLTITVNSMKWFGRDFRVANFDPNYRAASGRRNRVKINQILGKPGSADDRDIEYLGRWTGQAERGADYLKFRHWKDRKMVGNRALTDAELPVFGAVGVNWQTAYATEGDVDDEYWQAQAAERRETDPKKVKESQPVSGLNYYGDMHFKLDKLKLRNRLVYTATDHGRPHTDLFLMLADFLKEESSADPNYKANITGAKKASIQNTPNAGRLIAAALNTDKAIKGGLPFEVQIFGGVSLANDVEAVYFAPAVPYSVLIRMINAFEFAGLNIPVIPIPENLGHTVVGPNGQQLFDEVQRLIDLNKV